MTIEDTIELELTPQVKESEIVTSFVFRRGINSIVLSLNYVYSTKIIICPIDNLNWLKTSDNSHKKTRCIKELSRQREKDTATVTLSWGRSSCDCSGLDTSSAGRE